MLFLLELSCDFWNFVDSKKFHILGSLNTWNKVREAGQVSDERMQCLAAGVAERLSVAFQAFLLISNKLSVMTRRASSTRLSDSKVRKRISTSVRRHKDTTGDNYLGCFFLSKILKFFYVLKISSSSFFATKPPLILSNWPIFTTANVPSADLYTWRRVHACHTQTGQFPQSRSYWIW